jgi:transposase-like protein
VRWPGGVFCVHCESPNVTFLHGYYRWKCNSCKRQFTVRTGTVITDSALTHAKWLAGILAVTEDGSDVSINSLADTVGISFTTAAMIIKRLEGIGFYRNGLHNKPKAKPEGHSLSGCDWCGTPIKRRRKKGHDGLYLKHQFCGKQCFGLFRSETRAGDKCKRCGSQRHSGVNKTVFVNGMCLACYDLYHQFAGDEQLVLAHETNQKLRKAVKEKLNNDY